jgi:hypothetical protein
MVAVGTMPFSPSSEAICTGRVRRRKVAHFHIEEKWQQGAL